MRTTGDHLGGIGCQAVTIRLLLIGALVFAGSSICAAQASKTATDAAKASPAYAEVLLRRTELLAEADSLAETYTDEAPKMVDLRYELATLDKALARILSVKPADSGKLTLALGKLFVRHASLDTDVARLARTYNREHPEYKKTKKRLDVFEAAIREILP